MCALKEDQVSQNSEDGITEQTSKRLRDRKISTKVDSWEKLWDVLFSQPDGSLLCPSPEFEPPVEIDEVEEIFHDKENVESF
ncbi:unnamed protein product [Discula destructiva]